MPQFGIPSIIRALLRDKGGTNYNAQAAGILPNGTDYWSALMALMKTVHNAKGGTIRFETGDYTFNGGPIIFPSTLNNTNTTLTAPITASGSVQSVAVANSGSVGGNPAFAVGQWVTVGVLGAANLEVVQITAVADGTHISGIFAKSHSSTEPVVVYVGAVGSAVPQQYSIIFEGASHSSLGLDATRLLLGYQSSLSRSITASGPVAAGATDAVPVAVSFTGLSIRQTAFGKGSKITISDGTHQETARVTAITISGGVITAFTLSLIQPYNTGTNNLTLSWPLVDDAQVITLGRGSFGFKDIQPYDTVVGNRTPFTLITNTRPQFSNVELRGNNANAASQSPWAIHTNIYPVKHGVIRGGVLNENSGSIGASFAGYQGYFRDGYSYCLEETFTDQNFVTTCPIENWYFTVSCGSDSNLGAHYENHTSSAVPNNSTVVRDCQMEVTNMSQVVALAGNTQGVHILSNQMPDNFSATTLAAQYTANDAAMSLVGYLPPMTAAPSLTSRQYALGRLSSTAGVSSLVRIASIAPAGTTTLAAPAAVGATSIQVASATGISIGTGLLLDPGTYGGALGSTGIQEPAVVTAISGTTLTLASPLAYAHNSGVTVQRGPFAATLQASVAQTYVVGDYVSPSHTGVRIESGAINNRVDPMNCDAHQVVRDLNPGPRNTILPGNTGDVAVIAGKLMLNAAGQGILQQWLSNTVTHAWLDSAGVFHVGINGTAGIQAAIGAGASILLRASTGDTSMLLDGDGDVAFRVNKAVSTAEVLRLSTHRHLVLSSGTPAVAAGAQAGGSPPAPVLVSGGNDIRGQITAGTGTAPSAGALVVVTLSANFASTIAGVQLTPINAASAALLAYATAVDTQHFTIATQVAPAAGQANTVYGWYFELLG